MLNVQYYLVILILKLQPHKALLLVVYQYVYRHIVVFQQSLDLLFIIIYLLVIKLYKHIWVIWFSTSKIDIS